MWGRWVVQLVWMVTATAVATHNCNKQQSSKRYMRVMLALYWKAVHQHLCWMCLTVMWQTFFTDCCMFLCMRLALQLRAAHEGATARVKELESVVATLRNELETRRCPSE
jgi:hypothetical protein